MGGIFSIKRLLLLIFGKNIFNQKIASLNIWEEYFHSKDCLFVSLETVLFGGEETWVWTAGTDGQLVGMEWNENGERESENGNGNLLDVSAIP